MTLFARAMLVLFIVAWCVAAASWFYGTRYFLPMWAARVRGSDIPDGYGRKMLRGYAIFIGAVLFGLLVGAASRSLLAVGVVSALHALRSPARN